MNLTLSNTVGALDNLFDLVNASPDPSMSRNLPAVYENIGIDWQTLMEPNFTRSFNGLMFRGAERVESIYGACFPSAEVLDIWLSSAKPGDLLITHHPIDVRNGSPIGEVWAPGFVPIAAEHLNEIKHRGLSMYASHAPMDISPSVGTTAAILEAIGGIPTDYFYEYGDGHAGVVADISPISSSELASWARKTFQNETVELAGKFHPTISRIAILAGIGDKVETMQAAENLGAQAYVTGEIHVRIEGEYGRAKFKKVHEFADTTSMTLLGVSHAASEHLVIETQLSRWFKKSFNVDIKPIREPSWWR